MAPSKHPHRYQQKNQPNQQQVKVSKRKSRKKLWLIIGVIAILLISFGVYYVVGQSANNFSNQTPTPTPTLTPNPSASPSSTPTKVLLHTSMGDITIQLRDDKPITTGNFKNLVQQGKYDGTVFHRIIKDFMIQGGEINDNIPAIKDEIGANNRNLPYTIAMAKTSQPNSATSSFFINVVDNGNNAIDYDGTKFDSVYTVFGTVISGQSVVDAISKVAVEANPYTGEISQPLEPVTLIKATIIS